MKYLVTAAGSMSAEAVIRAINQLPSAKVVGCGLHPRNWTAASRLVETYYQVPHACEREQYLARVLRICSVEGINYAIPLTDPEVDVMSEHRQRFEAMGVTICIPSPSAVKIARDKLALYDFFSEHPRVLPIPTADIQDHKSKFELMFPLLAKPRRGRSRVGHVTIPDLVALKFWRDQLSGMDYVIQPLYIGDVFVVDVVRQPNKEYGGTTVAITRQELVRTNNGAGVTVQMFTTHMCDELAREVVELLGIKGCVNLEFLMVDSIPMLMDVNPRFSAGVAFTIKAGYDMVKNHLRCFDGNKIEASRARSSAVYVRSLLELSV